MNSIIVGNSLFVIGSLLFTSNCLINIFEELTLHSLLEPIAGLTFVIGSLLLMTFTRVE